MGEKEKRAFAFHLKTNEVPAHMMRETVSRAVRESRVFKDKLKPIEPVDYETYILQKRSTINNDPLRSMVMFPYDDVSASTIPRQLRTTRSTVPENAVKEASSLFVKECINSYTTEWKVINNKYHNYSGGFTDLQPSRLSKKEDLPDQKYEVDETDESRSEDSLLSPSGQTIKQGFLYKTPFGSRSDSGFMKTYRRRFFYLNQLADKSFLLEYHKDEHSVSSKGQVFLDSLVEVTKTSKQRKYGLELKMSDKTWYIAAETDSDMQEWYNALHQVLDQQKADANADKQSISSMDDLDTSEYADGDPNSSPDKTDFLAGLEKSKHPELQKYAKENERTNAQRRKEHRLNPFVLYPRMQIGSKSNHEPDSKPYEEEFGKRIIVEFSELKFRLAAHINEQGEPVEGSERNPARNVEPFFTSLALYDAKNNKKISEDLHIDINDPVVRGYLDRGGLDIPNGSGSSEKERRFSTLPDISDLNEEWLKYPKKGIFSVRQPNADIYLVVRIDKILQGNIAQCTDPYLKTGDLVKNCQKVMKSAKVYCSRTTQYRMPFAWAARRMFHELTGDIDMKASFTPIYRQESTKLTNDDLLKYLQDLRRNPEKLSKLTEIPGSISVYVEPFTRMLSNCLTSSLVPTMPWPSEPTEPPTLEVEEFTPESGNVAHPFTTYTNNIYVCPINLKYDGQKAYTKARNIAVCVEFRDCDDLDAKPVKCIYGRPGQSVFTTSASLPVLHHSQSPDFYEELKIAIPTQVCPKHHLLFRFYHVSCEMGKGTVKKKDIVDSFVGYAWLPLLDHGRINCGEVSVGVSSNLPAGYLDAKSMGLGKTIGPDVRWVDNGKPLLKVRLKLVSTVYTEAPHLHNFFAICESWGGTGSNALEVIQCVKAMHAVETHTLIHFLPVILNELFHLLPITLMDEVQLNVVRLMTFIVTQVHKVNRDDVLRSYVKYVFETERESEHKKTVHEELVKNLGVLLRSTHDATVIKNLLKHLWFFFSVLTKSMAQTLIMQDKLKAPRHSRFSTQFETNLRNLVTYLMPIILKKYNEHAQEAKEANSHLANFIKSCFTYMDRGFVFRLINCYLDHFDPNDPKPFFEMKFDLLRIICNHEHYIALNLPLQKKGQQTNRPIKALLRSSKDQYKDLTFIYQLTEEFCQNHFLTGLLLREVGMAIHDVTEVRQHGIKVLRNLLCKHSMDDRYSSKQHQSRIAILYLPLLSIILENAPRLVKETPANTPAGSVASVDTSFEGAGSLSLERHASISDSSDRNSVSYSQKTRSLQRDSTVLDIIAGRGVRHSLSNTALPDMGPITTQRRMSTGVLSFDEQPPLPSPILEAARSPTTPGSPKRYRKGSAASKAMIAGAASQPQSPTFVTTPPGFSDADAMSPDSPSAYRKESFSRFMPSPRTKRSSTPKIRPMSLQAGMIALELDILGNIAAPKISTPQPINDKEKMGSSQSLSSTTNDLKVTMNGHAGEGDKVDGLSPKPGHVRNKSTIMYDKLLDHEIKDLLVCFLYVIKNSNEDVLLGWWSRAPEEEQVQFFGVLELCLRHFQYLGKKQIVAARLREKPTKSSEERSQTLPVSRSRAMQTRSLVGGELPFVAALSEAEASHRITQEANMANEIGLIVLDVLGLYCTHFKALLDGDDGDNPLMRKVLDIFLSYLQLGQSETLQKHAFASLRAFVNKFPVACFKGSATLCADICLAMLKCLNSRLASTRSEACALLYLLMRNNFEFTQRKEFIRVHLQVIISVSKLIGEANSARFQESLALVNNYANSDRSMQHTSFPSQVKDLTKKIRTVLMATAQMKEHENDPEMLVDLQYSLAKSYASTPELRRTWLDSMARIHIDHGNYSEAAHCWIHIAALIAEYLRRNKGSYPQGCSAFKLIGPNIESEEKGMKDDTGMHDVVYSEQTLIDQLEQCTEGLQKAERYETMSEVYKLLLPFYERNRNFWRLAMAYGKLSEAYKTVMAVQHSGRRLLGQYFRVAFFGQHFEEDDGKVYIYKEPKVTALSDICHRLHSLYNDKYGAENVKLIQDSKKVNPEELDSAMAYIQITYVKPYFDDKELESRQTSYERSNNIRRFVYETPYTQDSNKPRTEKVEEQFKRKTIVTTGHAFPYVKKRILVVYVQQQELNPIQVAIDELKAKVHEMNDVLKVDKPDMKRLQLLLQGSVSVTVNAGPQAYAAAFLGKDCERKWKSQLVWELKQLFRQFVQVCGQSLEVNAKLIKSDQHEYHDDLVLNYKSMVANLSQLMMEKISDEETWQVSRRASGHIFNAISGTP